MNKSHVDKWRATSRINFYICDERRPITQYTYIVQVSLALIIKKNEDFPRSIFSVLTSGYLASEHNDLDYPSLTVTISSMPMRSDNHSAIMNAPRRNTAKGGRGGGGNGEGEEGNNTTEINLRVIDRSP